MSVALRYITTTKVGSLPAADDAAGSGSADLIISGML